MTTKEFERGKVRSKTMDLIDLKSHDFLAHRFLIWNLFIQSKCAHYWPDPGEVKEYEGIQLTHQKEVTNTDFTVREFVMSKDGEDRVIFQYHFQVAHLFCISTLLPTFLRFFRKST